MTLYVVNVADPPPGADWQTMVGGLYLWNVVSVAGRLVTPAAVGAMVDSSGNGRDGNYNGAASSDFVAGLVAGDLALRCQSAFDVLGWYIGEIRTVNQNQSWEAIVLPPAVSGFHVWQAQDTTGATQMGFTVAANGQVTFFLVGTLGFVSFATFPAAFPFNGLPHHLCATYSAVTHVCRIYVDGVQLAASPAADPGAPVAAMYGTVVGGTRRNVPFFPAADDVTVDEAAAYGTVLTAGQVAAHNAARGAGFAAYSAAVLADAPAAYYHLDNSGASTGRTPALDITDGTHIVAELASGFPAVPTSGPYSYTWLPGASSNSETAGGTIVNVALPRLVLPAGYTIGTFTPDIQPGDQWSDIAVWWNDNIQQARDPASRPKYPPGAYLVYQQRGAGP